jgi:hypothetical protein
MYVRARTVRAYQIANIAVQELAVETGKIGEEIFRTTLPLPHDYDFHLEARILAAHIRLTTWWDALPDRCKTGVLLVRYHFVHMNLLRGSLRPTPARNKKTQAATISAACEILTCRYVHARTVRAA